MWIFVEGVVFIMGVVSIGSQEISCNFSISSCGWTNDVTTTLNWTRQPVSSHNHYNYEMSLQMGQAGVNASGILCSPWMDGPITRRSVLRFYFDLGWCVGCKLSALLRTDTSSTLLWDTEQFSRSSGDVTTNITCTEQSFKILFEGKKTSHESDGTLYGILIDDIHFNASSSIATSEYPEGVTTIQQTAQPRSDETSTHRQGTDQLSTVETGNHLDGSTAGIVSICATVLAALAVLLIIVFFCWFQRRKPNDNGERNAHATERTEQRAEPNAVPTGIANNAYIHNELNVNGGSLGSIGNNLVLSNPSDQWSGQCEDSSMYDTLDNYNHQLRVSSTDISDNASYFGAVFLGRTDADNYQQTVPKIVDIPIFVCENNEQVTFV